MTLDPVKILGKRLSLDTKFCSRLKKNIKKIFVASIYNYFLPSGLQLDADKKDEKDSRA